jgi:hypothetical protein
MAQFFRGLISAQWELIVGDDTASSHPRTDLSPQATSYLALVIRALQDFSLAIWKSRNEELQQHAEKSREIPHAQLNHEITTMSAIRSPPSSKATSLCLWMTVSYDSSSKAALALSSLTRLLSCNIARFKAATCVKLFLSRAIPRDSTTGTTHYCHCADHYTIDYSTRTNTTVLHSLLE